MRQLQGPLWWLVSLYAAAIAAAHLYMGGFGFMEPLEMRSFHIGTLLPLTFVMFPARPGRSPADRPSVPDLVLAAVSVLPSFYVFADINLIYARMEFVDDLTPVQYGLGVIAIVLLLESIRRSVAPALAWMVVASLVYMYFGHLLPGVLNTKPFPVERIVEASYIVPIVGGIYGPLTGIVATTIAVFILFGSFVQGSGTGRLFNNLGAAAAGRYAGGPAKVAVITSGLFGTMSGSSVSNVVTTGSITIPLMKNLGYAPAVAGGIEAAASVGGALMPPVMGAAAFVMAEITTIPYSDIIVAAAIGAVLYYFAIFVSVHFEAKRLGLAAMEAKDIPGWRVVLADAHLVVPIAVLVVLMMQRWSGNFAAFCATVSMFAISLLKPTTRMNLRALVDTLAQAGFTMAVLAAAIAGAGVITSALTVTGLVVAFGGIIKGLAGGSLALLCFLIMFTVLMMGMGIPTTPSYIIVAAIGAPLMLEMGVPLLNTHLFIFYFAVLADATPPVAVAAYAAAAIAGASPMITGLHAVRFAIAGFVVGFAFVYDPAIMLTGSLGQIVLSTALLTAALTAIGSFYGGYLRDTLPVWLRFLVGLAGVAGAFVHVLPDWLRLVLPLAALALAWVLVPPRRVARA
ncbi:MAG: TRAP transporter fused permease subunit [Acetobacteraceae bacterium]|nr:TRAP transporter fused permease subunit [Acetobacteraceae bacterium]